MYLPSALPLIQNLITQKKIKDAALYISTLNLHDFFDYLGLVKTLINQEAITEAFLLIQNQKQKDKMV